MKIEFTGRQTEVPPDVRRLAERRIEKLARLLPRITRAHVVLSAERHRQVAEVSVHSRQLELAAIGTSASAKLSLARAIDKLLRQAQRQQAKRRSRKGAASPRLSAPPTTEPRSAGREPRAIRVKPLSRRRDGNPGLVEPEV